MKKPKYQPSPVLSGNEDKSNPRYVLVPFWGAHGWEYQEVLATPQALARFNARKPKRKGRK